MTVIDKDYGWTELGKRIDALAGGHVLVGVQGPKADAQHGEDGLTVADVVSFNEFGLGVPERSVIRATIDENEAPLLKLTADLGRAVVLDAMGPAQALGVLGLHAVGLMQERISNGIAPENRPSTVKKKGSSKPWIDTGQARQAFTHKVVL